MVPKILRTNQKDVNVPTVPVINNMARQINPMYPKYSKYVMTHLEASKVLNQNTLYKNVYKAVDPGAKKENHHQR